MQHEPEKLVANFNEFYGRTPPVSPVEGSIRLFRDSAIELEAAREIIHTGIKAVNAKVDQILGPQNRLTTGNLAYPEVHFYNSMPERPNWAGCFRTSTNQIYIVTDKIENDPLNRTKVFVHEYIHFLSHNGRDKGERIDENSPLAINNNVGFQRYFGLDIRAGREGEVTGDYFLAFNEAVTEQLARDVIPGVHETYKDYCGLLNQVIDDAVQQRLGSKDAQGEFQSWDHEQVKQYIYRCFLMGNLTGFTNLLQTTYKKYELTEQQFGLMTHKNDLPSLVERTMQTPDSPPPAPSLVAQAVQRRLDMKTPEDYTTDVIGPEPDSGDGRTQELYGAEYDKYVQESGIIYSHTEVLEGEPYQVDSQGYIIYDGDRAASILEHIMGEIDQLLSERVAEEAITERVDTLLFETYKMSMLSAGFRNFYIAKHVKLQPDL